jgi:very-short-patch-repair endonuclease
MAAVLSCGPEAALSHGSAAVLWGIAAREQHGIEVSVPARSNPRPTGIVVHRRRTMEADDVTRREGIPLTGLVLTLVDLATRTRRAALERAINEADKLDLVDPETLRSTLDRMGHRPGGRVLRELLDHPTFALTDSELERRFPQLVRGAGLSRPKTGQHVNGFEVDFYWSDLGLVVETDGLRYHRTPSQQARDRRRDQAHVSAGLTCLRFTHSQVTFEPDYVKETLRAVARRRRAHR